MTRTLFSNHMILIASLMVFLLILPGVSLASELVKGTMMMPEVQRERIAQKAAESVQDTLKACLSRIPSDATAGQLLLAEQSCEQVDLERNKTHLSF